MNRTAMSGQVFLFAFALLSASSETAAAQPPQAIAAQIGGDLEPYRPCRVRGSRTGSATAILSRLGPAWATAFHRFEPAATMDLHPRFEPPLGPASEGLRRFLDGESDFALLSRDLAESDLARFVSSHGYEPTRIAVAGGSWRSFGHLDAVAVVVNDANPVRALSFAQIDAVLSRTRLRGHAAVVTWDQLGAIEWAGKPVHVIGGASWQGEDSARATVVRERILSLNGRRGEWRGDLPPESGREAEVPDLVAADPLAIGFTGLGHVKPGSRAIAIVDGGDVVAPSFEAVAHARYPLARTVNLLLALPPGKASDPMLVAIGRFLLSREGQDEVRKTSVFLPLTAAQARSSLRLLGASGKCDRNQP